MMHEKFPVYCNMITNSTSLYCNDTCKNTREQKKAVQLELPHGGVNTADLFVK
jgi:hypothetical protein